MFVAQELENVVEASLLLGHLRFQNTGWTPGGHLGIFWVGMCSPGLQIGTPF